MALALGKLIEETFGDLQNLSPEKLQGLIQETMKTFVALQEKMRSENPTERDEALQTAVSLKETLQAQAEVLCQKLGIDPSQLPQFAETALHFAGEEGESLNGVKKEMEAFKQQFAPEQKTAPIVKKSKTSPKTWLVG